MTNYRLRVDRAAIGRVKAAAAAGLRPAAERIMDESRGEVPLLTGELRDSGFVEQAGPTRVALGYRDSKAVPQHEKLDYHHPGGRKAKYLEDPWNAARRDVLDSVARAARRAVH